MKKGGFIYDAISTQEWSGEAAVHVSIVNWMNEQPTELFLDNVEVPIISTALKSEAPVDSAIRLADNKNFSFQACELAGKGFILSEKEAQTWIEADLRSCTTRNTHPELKFRANATKSFESDQRTGQTGFQPILI